MGYKITDYVESSSTSYLQATTNNASVPEGCVEFRFDQKDYIPWDNPDNIISADVERIARKTASLSLVPVLFLIGLPANVINMAVFYKQSLKERINLCLFALSLADELYLFLKMLLYCELMLRYFNVNPSSTLSSLSPVTVFMTDNHLIGFFGVSWTSQVLSAMIATERCLCVTRPLKFQAMLKTKATGTLIIAVFIMITGPYFLVASRYTIACVYNSLTDTSSYTFVESDFYKSHEKLVNYLDLFVYGACMPVFSIIVVTTSTIITVVKLREIVIWRAETSYSISAREVALTKMLIGNSVFFIACVSPVAMFRLLRVFLPEVNVGRRHQNFYQLCLLVMDILFHSNSSLNMFVYYIMGSRYRETFRILFSRRQTMAVEKHAR